VELACQIPRFKHYGFFWGFVKSVVYETLDAEPNITRHQLEDRIRNAFLLITPEMLAKARASLVERVALCLESNGGLFEHLL